MISHVGTAVLERILQRRVRAQSEELAAQAGLQCRELAARVQVGEAIVHDLQAVAQQLRRPKLRGLVGGRDDGLWDQRLSELLLAQLPQPLQRRRRARQLEPRRQPQQRERTTAIGKSLGVEALRVHVREQGGERGAARVTNGLRREPDPEHAIAAVARRRRWSRR